jgi:heme/copper-type cytochrome/quinol oxidase subunit 4
MVIDLNQELRSTERSANAQFGLQLALFAVSFILLAVYFWLYVRKMINKRFHILMTSLMALEFALAISMSIYCVCYVNSMPEKVSQLLIGFDFDRLRNLSFVCFVFFCFVVALDIECHT